MKTIKQIEKFLNKIPYVSDVEVNSSTAKILYDVENARKNKKSVNFNAICNEIGAKDWEVPHSFDTSDGVYIIFYFN